MECFKYLGSQVAADGGCERDVVHRMNGGIEREDAEKCNRRLRTNAKNGLCDGVIRPTA